MNAQIILDSSFPHGTPTGYLGGCRGSQCPSVMACRDVYRRYSGDWGFKRMFDAGMTVVEIAADEAEQARVEAERAREIKLAARRKPKIDKRPAANRARPKHHVVNRQKLRELLDKGFTDRQIADELKVERRQVTEARNNEGWAINPDQNNRRTSIDDRLHEVAHLSYVDAAKVLGRAPSYIRRRRQIAAKEMAA